MDIDSLLNSGDCFRAAAEVQKAVGLLVVLGSNLLASCSIDLPEHLDAGFTGIESCLVFAVTYAGQVEVLIERCLLNLVLPLDLWFARISWQLLEQINAILEVLGSLIRHTNTKIACSNILPGEKKQAALITVELSLQSLKALPHQQRIGVLLHGSVEDGHVQVCLLQERMLHVHLTVLDLCRDDKGVDLTHDLEKLDATLTSSGTLLKHLGVEQLNLEEELIVQLSWISSMILCDDCAHLLDRRISGGWRGYVTESDSVDQVAGEVIEKMDALLVEGLFGNFQILLDYLLDLLLILVSILAVGIGSHQVAVVGDH